MAELGRDKYPDAFLSYARLDDEVSDGYISWLREKLEGQVNAEIGKGSFRIFQDTDEIPAGANWTSALEEALAGARFLIPVLSPSYFASQPCLFELAKFHGFETSSGRKDLIIPIFFRDIPDHWDDQNNPHIVLLRERHIFDWRSLRRRRRDDPEVINAIERLAADIRTALVRTSTIARANSSRVEVITAPEALATLRGELGETRLALDQAREEANQAKADLTKILENKRLDYEQLTTERDNIKLALSQSELKLHQLEQLLARHESSPRQPESLHGNSSKTRVLFSGRFSFATIGALVVAGLVLTYIWYRTSSDAKYLIADLQSQLTVLSNQITSIKTERDNALRQAQEFSNLVRAKAIAEDNVAQLEAIVNSACPRDTVEFNVKSIQLYGSPLEWGSRLEVYSGVLCQKHDGGEWSAVLRDGSLAYVRTNDLTRSNK